MKNYFYSFIGIIMVLSLLLTGITISADDIYQEKEIVFNSNSAFSEDEKEIITAALNSEQETYGVYGLKCTLFGHTYKTEYVTAITHKASNTSPRCLREVYETKICEDCSDTQTRLISASMIACCE